MSNSDTDVAIIGGGPVGLGAANLLGHLGISCVLFEQNETTSFHPRGHVVNTRTMEILRAVDLESPVNAAALPLHRHAGIGFVTSLSGDQIGSIETRSDATWERVERSQSPELKRSCPQDVLEPILREGAANRHGVELRFGHRVDRVEQDATGVTLHWTAGDGTEGQTRAKYLIAADGPRSTARDAAGIEMEGRSIGQQIGIYFHADLWALIQDRPYLLWWIYNATTSGVLISLDGRHRWTYNFGYRDDQSRDEFTEDVCRNLVNAVIGTNDIEVDIKNIMPWRMQARIANTMSAGRIFIAGDAAHPLPPTGGQGMNTGIADVHNLAWKLKLVLAGHADESLLQTYSEERRPVAKFNVEQSARNAMAMQEKGLSGMLANDSVFLQNIEGPAGAANRAKLAEGIPAQRGHFDYPGQTFGYYYESALISPDGTPAPEMTVETYFPDARPGHRAPHLQVFHDGAEKSILDLFSLEAFTLLTASEATGWREAANQLAGGDVAPFQVYRVGRGGDVLTDEAQWLALYGLTETGAVLVRPDGHVAWRSQGAGDAMSLFDAFDRAIGRSVLTQNTFIQLINSKESRS